MSVKDSRTLVRAGSICFFICVAIAVRSESEIKIYFFNAFFIGLLVATIYSFAKRWIGKDFHRPAWLESLYAFSITTGQASILATALRWGDMNIVRSIGCGCLIVLGMCVVTESFLGILGFKIDLGVKRKSDIAIAGLVGLFIMYCGISVLID